MQKLLTYLMVYAVDHEGDFPACLSDLEIEEDARGSILYWRDASNPPTPMHYITGITDSTIESIPVVASPLAMEDNRLVGFLDGHYRSISEKDWQTLLRTTLEDPELSLRTTFKTP